MANKKNNQTKDINGLAKTTSMKVRTFQFITKSEITVALRRSYLEHNVDVKSLSKDLLKRDQYTVYVCLNTWCALFEDITPLSGSILADRIRLYGIDASIAEAEDYRLKMLSTDTIKTLQNLNGIVDVTVDFHTPKMKENLFWYEALEFDHADEYLLDNVGAEVIRMYNTLLGFPRRLRIEGNSKNPDMPELTKFIEGNDKMRRFNNGTYCWGNGKISYEDWEAEHVTTPKYLVDGAREVINVLFKDYKQNTSLFALPPGATFEGHKTYYQKWKQILENQQWLREHGVNVPVLPADVREPSDCCRFVVVPKNYKTGRNVAPEPVAKQVLGYQIDSGMRSCLRKFGFDLSNQGLNQEACKEAYNLRKATIDWSAASDSISLWLVRELFADLPELLSQLEACRSDYVVIPQKNGGTRKMKNYRFATMGNAITFSLETAVFIAIACVAIDMSRNYYHAGRPRTIESMLKLINVYGDDTIIPDYAVPYLLDIAPLFGLTLNQEKSYWGSQLYRESCGVEFFRDKNITGTYWPRGLSTQAYPELISLQHHLWQYPLTNRFLMSCVLDVFPDTTVSEPESEYMDLWVPNPIIRFSESASPKGFFFNLALIPEEIVAEVFQKGNRSPRNPEWGVIRPGEFVPNKLTLKDQNRQEQPKFHFKVYELPDVMFSFIKRTYPNLVIHLDRYCLTTAFPAVHEEKHELHTTVTSRSGKIGNKIYSQNRREVDCLAYYLTLGGGVEHANSSDYTREVDRIFDRLDLVSKREIYIENKDYAK